MQNKLTRYILIAMMLGLFAGFILNVTYAESNPELIASLSKYLGMLPKMFITLIKMIIAPLVFSTLVVGIGSMGDGKSAARIGMKAMALFLIMSFISLGLGLVMVNVIRPGDGIDLSHIAQNVDVAKLHAAPISLENFIEKLIPTSIVKAMAENSVLQIVVFSVFFGIACLSVGEEHAKPILTLLDSVIHVVLKVTGYVMNFAPLGVFGAITAALAKHGVGLILTYGKFMGGFFAGLGVLWIIIFLFGLFILKDRFFELLGKIKQILLVAFTTASSEAVYPQTLSTLEDYGCPRKISSFVLPLGYSFNLTGSMIYCTFATLFIAQMSKVELSTADQITMLLMMMLTSKGIAAVPRASLVVIAATLPMFNIPEAGLALVLAVDHFLDMGRTVTSTFGNIVSTVSIAKWEGLLEKAKK
jgi:Na+/H+-dicarboxylate symporter